MVYRYLTPEQRLDRLRTIAAAGAGPIPPPVDATVTSGPSTANDSSAVDSAAQAADEQPTVSSSDHAVEAVVIEPVVAEVKRKRGRRELPPRTMVTRAMEAAAKAAKRAAKALKASAPSTHPMCLRSRDRQH